MFNAKYILPGLAIALLGFTSPFWLNLSSEAIEYPQLAIPKGENQQQCVEPKEWMRAEHMTLLNTWRDEAVRLGKREYVATDGSKWTISLQNTCMACHSDMAGFCDKCHVSNSVVPYCWDCHVAPRGNN